MSANKNTQKYILALDQGTSSSRSIIYDLSGNEIASSAYEYSLSYPNPGWVELDANDIWQTQKQSMEDVLKEIDPVNVKAIGITNQRETVIAWNKTTGESLAPAIVWQCRRTSNFCEELKEYKNATLITEKTGLKIDPYFSASKICWLLDNNKTVRKEYQRDNVIFGTVDSWLIYNLTKHNSNPTIATDSSNASRTMLYNLHTDAWDKELLNIFEIKESSLPQIRASNANFGSCILFGMDAPINGVLGDQQSSLFGHGAYQANDLKCTFGTGAFLLKNTGSELKTSNSGLLSTIAWSLEKGGERQITYALEGSIYVAGTLIKWLRDQLGIIKESKEVDQLAENAKPDQDLTIVPAFTGLGSPYWDSDVRASFLGINSDTSKAEIAYASLEAIAQQLTDLLDLQELNDVEEIKIDGGLSKSKIFNQILADLSNCLIKPASRSETTAYGAFCIAAYGSGLMDPFANKELFQSDKQYLPTLEDQNRNRKRKNWERAIKATLVYK